MCTARKTLQFAWDHLQDGFAGAKVFEHKTSFESPSTDVSHLPFGCNSFIELPPLDLTRCPNFMLAVFAIKQLILAARNTAQLMGDCTRFDHFAHDTGNGHRIVGMGFGKAKHLDTLVLRLVAIAHGNLICPKDRLEALDHGGFESRYMSGIFQRDASLSLDLGIPKLSGRLLLLAHIAGLAGQREIAHPITSTSGPGDNMFDLQRDSFRPTISTVTLPLLQEILTQEIALQFALLVFQTGDFRVLHLLGVEPSNFHVDLAHRQDPRHELHGLDRRFRLRTQRWRHPASGPAAIGKAGSAIAGVAETPRAAVLASLRQLVRDIGTQVDLGLIDHRAVRGRGHPYGL